MATEKRLIDANALIESGYDLTLDKVFPDWHELPESTQEAVCKHGQYLKKLINEQPTVDAVEIPCKIGDFVWAIRNFKGKKHPQRGVVSDMYFLNDMSLQIVVKYVARGKWGETVFATDKEAYAAIGERKRQ